MTCVPLIILIDTLIALARGWRFPSRLDRLGAALLLAFVIGAVLARMMPRGRKFLARFAPQICLASMATIVGLLLAELVSMVILPRTEMPVHLRKPLSQSINRLVPGVMRGISGESRTIINSQGVRGDEMPADANRYAILCLGASSTNCTYLDQAETWAAVLQRTLNEAGSNRTYWVGNVGIPSLTTSAHLKFLNESELPKQVDCLILQTGINDFMQSIAPPRPSPPYWIQSHIWQLATTVARSYLNSSDITVEDQAGTSYVSRRKQRMDADKVTTLPNLDDGLSAYAERLRAMIERAKALGLKVVVTSQPVLWTGDAHSTNESLFWFGKVGPNQYLATPQLRKGMDEFNRTTRTICAELNVEFIDLDNLNGRDDVFYDDCHFTEEGARQVGKRIADHILAHPSGVK